MIRKFRREQSARGSTMVELAVSLSIITTLVFGGIDLLTIYRYASAAYSVAVLTARFGSVETPNAAYPSISLLKIPVDSASHPEYLTAWRDSLFLPGGEVVWQSSPPYPDLNDSMRAALNLGLGWAKELLPKIKTVSTWGSAADVRAELPEPGEMYLVPLHYIRYNFTADFSEAHGNYDYANNPWVEYQCCIRVPSLFLAELLVCRKARASYYEI